MSHTPGPWWYDDALDDEELYARPVMAHGTAPWSPYDACLAVACCDDDACLIAAAPDLLAACELVVAALPATRVWTAAENAALAAVKKARGER